MPRIRPIEPKDANPRLQALYAQLTEDLGIEPNNFFKTMGHSPDLLRPRIEFSRVMLEGGVLDRRLKEWVILQIGRLCKCDYVYDAHKQALSRAIMSDLLGDRRAALDTSSLDEREKLAIRYAGQITDNQVDDETYAELEKLFDTEEILELTVLASYYNFICRTVNALGVEMDVLKFLAPQTAN